MDTTISSSRQASMYRTEAATAEKAERKSPSSVKEPKSELSKVKGGKSDTTADFLKSMQAMVTQLVTFLQEMITNIVGLMGKLAGAETPVTKTPKGAKGEPADTDSASSVTDDDEVDSSVTTDPPPGTASLHPVEPLPVTDADEVELPEECECPATEEGMDTLEAIQDPKTKQVKVTTKDGYTVNFEAKEQAWTVTDPDGKVTRIWGDPHVAEHDGDTFDFYDQSSFRFGKNKATVETIDAGNGTTYSSKVTIYNGDERVTIEGIDKNDPRITAAANDRDKHDRSLKDGITYTIRKDGNITGQDKKESATKKSEPAPVVVP